MLLIVRVRGLKRNIKVMMIRRKVVNFLIIKMNKIIKIIQKKIVKVQMILVKLRINLAAGIAKNQMKKKLI